MVGGVLCERTVKEVLPILISNQEQVRFTLLMIFIVGYIYTEVENPVTHYLDTQKKKTSRLDCKHREVLLALSP